VRWKHFRVYFTDMHPTGEGPQRIGGVASADAPMAGYPRMCNIEADPHEDLNVSQFNSWLGAEYLKAVVEYERSVKEHPNPPAPNMTRFMAGG
jgi:arylsulfatase